MSPAQVGPLAVVRTDSATLYDVLCDGEKVGAVEEYRGKISVMLPVALAHWSGGVVDAYLARTGRGKTS